MLSVGDKAPDFTLAAHSGEPVTLSSFQGEKNVVLSFHIYSFTGGWTHQVSSFRVHNTAFEEVDTQVLGISCDSKAAQSAFSGSLGGIPYPILSDFYPHGEVSDSYGVFDAKRGTPKRAIVVVDKKGVIKFINTYRVATDLNPTDVLETIKSL